MARRSAGSVEAWWRALAAVRLLRGLSRRELARAIQDAVPRRDGAPPHDNAEITALIATRYIWDPLGCLVRSGHPPQRSTP